MFEMEEARGQGASIKVIGVGGAGGRKREVVRPGTRPREFLEWLS